MNALFEPLAFSRGPVMRNRFMLAPLTNLQSHADGVLSDEEFKWLTMRARGGFGLVMTCAAHVQAGGQGFPATRRLLGHPPRRTGPVGHGGPASWQLGVHPVTPRRHAFSCRTDRHSAGLPVR